MPERAVQPRAAAPSASAVVAQLERLAAAQPDAMASAPTSGGLGAAAQPAEAVAQLAASAAAAPQDAAAKPVPRPEASVRTAPVP